MANILFEIPSALDTDSNLSLEVASYVGDNPYEVVTIAEATPMELSLELLYRLFLPMINR